MDIEAFRDYCLSLPGSYEKMPFEHFFKGKHSFLAFYVGGKMFCFFDLEAADRCTLKCRPEEIDELEERYVGVERPYNLSPRYWVSVRFDSDVPEDLLKRLVRQSYELVQAHKKASHREDTTLPTDTERR